MELPNELIDEILTRVPVKYVLRCRCVSKGWCSIIDNNVFVKKYLKVSIERDRGGLIIQGSTLDDSDGKYLLADIDCFDDGSAVIDISEEVGGFLDGARVIGSDNGLVCLSMLGDSMHSMFLLNRCTRKCKKLPVAGNELLDKNNLSRDFLGGFGYDHVSDDYKVVLMAWWNLPTNGIMAIVYSLKKNSWTPISGVYRTENIRSIDIRGTLLYGVLRWKAVNVRPLHYVIVGFDLCLEQFTEAQCCNGNVELVDISIEKSRAEKCRQTQYLEVLGLLDFLCTSLEKILLEVEYERFMSYDLLEARHLRMLLFLGFRFVLIHTGTSRVFSHSSWIGNHHKKQKRRSSSRRKRFLTIVLVLSSVVGSLMFFSRSRRGTG